MPNSFRLVGDLGGTNARFALVEQQSAIPREIAEVRCSDHESLTPAIRYYLNSKGNPELSEAVIAAGTPIVGDYLKMTNNHWAFSQSEVTAAFHLDNLQFINDFTAQALSLPLLGECDVANIGSGKCVRRGPKAVLGPGTGLGVSGLIPSANGGWAPLQGEGGHVTVVPGTDREAAIIDWMAQTLTDSSGHVSAERLLSGPGLCLLYQSVHAIDNHAIPDRSAAEISNSAINGSDPRAIEALDIFCRQLGAVAGDLALTLGATGGVYIAGGMVPRMLDYVAASQFRTAFESKGRMSKYLSPIATLAVTRRNPALLGAASLLSDRERDRQTNQR
ncbi:MAG: glucokinase [Granulosicoccus sp.]|nr:glucokinase [Granulosicoccus sp.]